MEWIDPREKYPEKKCPVLMFIDNELEFGYFNEHRQHFCAYCCGDGGLCSNDYTKYDNGFTYYAIITPPPINKEKE
jgi:hypothetical protein